MFRRAGNYLGSQKGFSMLEIMLMLVIMLVLLAAAIIPLPKQMDRLDKKLFLYQLQADLYWAKSYAITKQETVNLQFLPIEKSYRIRTLSASRKMLVKRKLPASIRHVNGSLDNISFLPNGNANRFGTILFFHKEEYFSIVCQIGKGRFYVKEG
ncbi:competence type IV pilus minor pilin ComGD [Bacillus xiapuensis]|uniref:competence type IV pilus minor pilin ComGD n=1 Tax=Bacillus xiapuensis TaxID=2014075 RepID=UPI000C24129E|nr:competence type IV pilus minor pilin ComGD [Bacillus xiapuensis]